MRLASAVALVVLVAEPDAQSFDPFTLADGKPHCFNVYAAEYKLDLMGFEQDDDKPIRTYAAKACFVAELEKDAFCRWSVEPLPSSKGLTFVSAVLIHEGKDEAPTGWRGRGWSWLSKDYSKDALTGTGVTCHLAADDDGGGFLAGTVTELAKHRTIRAAVRFGAKGERLGKVPPAPRQPTTKK